MSVKVLIVDDNAMYRSAFRRNLLIRDYDVFEAENSDEAISVFQDNQPEVVVTDLSMRTPKEGLDVIRSIRKIEPLIPVVMISAVGTFEEGAEANRLGAHAVISKSRIDEEIDTLYSTIESAQEIGKKNRLIRDEIEEIAKKEDGSSNEDANRLREIISDESIHASVRGDAYDVLSTSLEATALSEIQSEAQQISTADIESSEAKLKSEFDDYQGFDASTRRELRTAEYFFQQSEGQANHHLSDFNRNIGFSYCFAVENEAKLKLRKRLQRFLSQKDTIRLIKSLIDPKNGQLDLFYHQYLARMQHMQPFDFTVDNVRQVFHRIREHESRYKPDGLKALGIMILCFGRNYETKTIRKTIKIENPLHLRGLENDEEVSQFAYLLVSLQHYRNPYIHPEISEMEKISNIRKTTIECLRLISKIQP